MIQDLVDKRAVARWEQDYDKADLFLAELRTMHVRVDDSANRWYGPGNLQGPINGPGTERSTTLCWTCEAVLDGASD